MISKKTQEKIQRFAASALVHVLMYIGGSVIYFIIALKFIFDSISFSSFGAILSSLLNVIFMGLGWILFTVIWVFVARALHGTGKKLKEKSREGERVEGTNLSIREYRQFFSDGEEKIATLKELILKIKKREVREKVDKIRTTLKRIYEFLREEPREIRRAHRFTEHYVGAGIKIIQKYVTFTGHSDHSEEARQTVIDIEENLDAINLGFEKQLTKLLEHDVMDIDAELKVLQNALKSEGLR